MSHPTVHPAQLLGQLEQRARKRFGQNFLVDEHAVKNIVSLSQAGPGRRVLEIGPGLGAMTGTLLETGCDLRCVELDRDLAAFLTERHQGLELIQADAMKLPLDELAPGDGWIVAANLPYNVGTRILLRMLPQPRFTRLVLMFQLEVAQRIVAEPRTKAWSSLSVMAQVFTRPYLAIHLPPTAFHPRPKIHSAVVVFERREQPLLGGVDPVFFEKVVRAGFSQRRKTLRNALSTAFDKAHAARALDATVGGGKRAEELKLEDWSVLAAALA